MPLVQIKQPRVGPQKTRLSADVAASATTSTVDNNAGLTTNTYILFGKLGQEKTELLKLTSTTGNTTLGHTTGPVFAHTARTPIFEIRYNQVEISSSSAEDGTYTVLSTFAFAPDEPYIYYDDTAGTTATWYRARYYNLTTTLYSEYADSVQGTGYLSNSLRAMSNEVLDDFGDPLEEEITRKQIRRWLNAGVRKLATKLITLYPDYRRQYTTQALTASTATYNLPTRFIAFIRVDVNYTGTTATGAKKVEKFESESEGYPDTSYQTSDPRVFIRADKFGLRPTPTSSSGMAFLWHWDYPAEMADEADVHGLPYGANEYLTAYCLYRAWLTKDQDRAAGYKDELKDIFDEYVTFMATSRQGYRNSRIDIDFGADLYSQD